MTQSIFPMLPDNFEDLPVPERIAQFFDFKLAYHDTPNGRFYAVQDWIIGVAQTDNPRDFWYAMKKRIKRAGFDLSIRCRQLSYLAKDGKNYRTDHADAETLYLIAQRMDAETGIRDTVLKYLAKAGVILDEMMRNPAEAAQTLGDVAYKREYRKLLSEGFTPEEAQQWLDVRNKQKRQRKIITAIWKARDASERDFSILTNQVHNIALGRTATEHKRQLAIKDTPRNYVSAADNAAIQITEFTAGLMHESRDSYGVGELSEDIEDVRPIMNAARPEIDKAFSMKPRRLRGGNPPTLKG